MLFLYVICIAAVIFVFFGFIALFVGPKGRGVPFFPTSRKRVETMLRFAGDVRGKRIVDLGSGDGRIVIAFARAGAEAHGYELNPVLVLWSHIRIKLFRHRRSHIHFGNFWDKDLSSFDVIFVFGLHPMMSDLEKKLLIETKPGALVISNTFKFPTWPSVAKEGEIYVYER